MKTVSVRIPQLFLNKQPACANGAGSCPMLVVKYRPLFGAVRLCQFTGDRLPISDGVIDPCASCPVHNVKTVSRQAKHAKRKYHSDPAYRAKMREKYRAKVREKYRAKKGIPLDAPVRQYIQRSRLTGEQLLEREKELKAAARKYSRDSYRRKAGIPLDKPVRVYRKGGKP